MSASINVEYPQMSMTTKVNALSFIMLISVNQLNLIVTITTSFGLYYLFYYLLDFLFILSIMENSSPVSSING